MKYYAWYNPYQNVIFLSWFNNKTLIGKYLIQTVGLRGAYIKHDTNYCTYLGEL